MSPTFLSDLTGPVGPMGPVNPSSAPADTAVAGWITTTGTSATKTALNATFLGKVVGLIPTLTDATTKASNAAILTAAIVPESRVRLPKGRFFTNAVTLVGPFDVTGEGGASDATTIANDTGTVLMLEGAHCNFRDIAISSYGGGDTVVQTASINQSHWQNFSIYQLGTGFSAWNNAGFEFVDMSFSDAYSHHQQGATVPTWKLVGVGGIINNNKWEKIRAQNSGNYHFWVESTSANAQYRNVWEDITFEVCTGGGIRLISVRDYAINGATNWDMIAGAGGVITLQRPFIHASANASNIPCVGVIEGMARLAGANAAGIVDILLPAGGLGAGTVIIRSENVSGGDPLTINALDNVITVIGGMIYTIQNDAGTTVINGTLSSMPTLNVGSGWAVRKATTQLEIRDSVNSRSQMTLYPAALPKDALTLFDSIIGLATSTTANRPVASNVGPGSMWYDTTLGKPIWSNGAVWKDAAGTTV